MKSKLFLLSLVALTLTFIACNKKDGVKSEADATISVAIKSVDLRTYEDGTDTVDMQVKTLAVMVCEGQTQIAYKEAATAGDLEAKSIGTTTGTKTLLVAANFKETDFQGESLNDALAMTREPDADGQDPVKGKRILASNATPATLKKGKNFCGYADGDGNHTPNDPMQLKHIHAGMSFTSIKVGFATQYRGLCNVKFDKGAVMALIVKGQSDIFGASLINADPSYLYGKQYSGQADNRYTPKADYKEMAEFKTAITEISETITGKGFYMLKNNSAGHPTILRIRGGLTQKGGTALAANQAKGAVATRWIVLEADRSTFYPVLINWRRDGYTSTGTASKKGIVRNDKYEISLTITDPGTNSPEESTQERASLDVMYKITFWNTARQEVVW